MCTIGIAWGTHPRYPLIVAANRDEVFGRAATPPVVHSAHPRIVGGRDVEKSGTWFALRPDGFFCGLTNRRPETPPSPAARSRGEVVLEVLRAAGPDAAAKYVAGLDAREYNGFNLIFGTTERLYTASVWPWLPAPEVAAVSPGVHVLPTSRLDAPDYPKVERLRARLAAPLPEDWPALRVHLQAALADHTQPAPEAVRAPAGGFFSVEVLCALDALCIHLPAYGTRSSSLLALAPGRVLHAEHAEGAPCTHDFVSFEALLRGDP
jgi:uncharacterized protein with NRDE domain